MQAKQRLLLLLLLLLHSPSVWPSSCEIASMVALVVRALQSSQQHVDIMASLIYFLLVM